MRKPHYLLFCDASPSQANDGSLEGNASRRWRFALENIEDRDRMEATDIEPNATPDRIALLSVVRGLEAIEQPASVTLLTNSRYVARGIQFGLLEWRESEYCWEHFGSVQPIRNADLWRRIDHALQYHQVQTRCLTSAAWLETDESETAGVADLHYQPSIDSVSSDSGRRFRFDHAHDGARSFQNSSPERRQEHLFARVVNRTTKWLHRTWLALAAWIWPWGGSWSSIAQFFQDITQRLKRGDWLWIDGRSPAANG